LLFSPHATGEQRLKKILRKKDRKNLQPKNNNKIIIIIITKQKRKVKT